MHYRLPSARLKPAHPGAGRFPPPAAATRRAVLLAAAALAAATLGGGGCGRGGDEAGEARQSAAGAEAESPRELAAAHILIMYEGSRQAPEGLRRTREEAENLALRLAMEAREGSEFEELALKHSDEPGVETTAGHLGNFAPTDVDVALVATLLGIGIGEITVHESEFGFHVVKRLAVERALARHILIAWRGARNAPETVTRTEPQAEALALEVRRMAAAPGADLCELVRRFSDDIGTKIECGMLGVMERGGTAPAAVERAVFRLRPGQVSDPIRSEYGYHVFWRER